MSIGFSSLGAHSETCQRRRFGSDSIFDRSLKPKPLGLRPYVLDMEIATKSPAPTLGCRVRVYYVKCRTAHQTKTTQIDRGTSARPVDFSSGILNVGPAKSQP